MPTTVTDAPYRLSSFEPARKLWTRAECAAFEATGLWDQQKLELIEGELIDKMGKKRPHTNGQTFTQGWLIRVFGVEFVNIETPIDVAQKDNPTSEPQPDAIVLNRPTWEINRDNPQPADVALVVEVSDSSLAFDLTRKAALYARAGIQDYWVLDVIGRRLIVHRQPASGKYTSVVAYDENESVAPLAAPASEFHVAAAFPQR
jgi:Uma2 family endonuclease